MLPRFAVSSFLLALMAAPAYTQIRPPAPAPVARTFSLRGTLRDNETSRAMEMIKVDLKRLSGETVSTTFTRSNGEFEFNGLPNGVYYVIVEEKGYENIREMVEIVNSSRAGVFIFLTRPFQPTGSAPGPSVSAHQLSIPQHAHDAWQKGMDRLYGKNDPKASIAYFERAITEVPTYYEAYHHLGVAYIRMGKGPEAEQSLRKSIELSENNYAGAYFELASLLSNNQRFDEAEKVAGRGVEIDPNAWQGRLEMARALLGMNRVNEAEKNLEEARKRKNDYAPLYLVSANVHIRKKNYPALLDDLDAYLKLEPSGPMSDQARQMREQVQRALASAKNDAPAPKPQP